MTRRSHARCSRFAALIGVLFVFRCGGPATSPDLPGNQPASDFSTYLGGGDTEMIRDVAIDPQGNVYVAGSTSSGDYPVTSGAYDRFYNATGTFLSDGFVTKLDPSGHIIWSTFLGGPDYERVYAMEVDEQGFVYVAGRAGPGFPTTPGSLQPNFGGASDNPGPPYGPQDGFICKLRPEGGVVFCTYFGDTAVYAIRDIAIDANHDIYIATSSAVTGTFPAAWFANAYQKTIRGARDGLLAKIRGDGSGVVWATLIGGSAEEGNTNTIRVDATGVYFAMFTHSVDLPTPNGFDHTLSGMSDVYVAKFSLDGSTLLYGTYVGGSGQEDTETHHLEIDGQGHAYAVVPSTSSDFPTTAGAYQPQAKGGRDALVVKIAPDGRLAAATYLGGTADDWPEGVTVDAAGQVCFSGGTRSANFPTTGGQAPGGGLDLYGAVFSSDLTSLLFSRRVGGSGNEQGRGAAVRGSVFAIGGMSNSANWPVVAAAQSTFHGVYDAVAIKLTKTP